ncbi:ISH3 family transposase [Methanococcoides sp.]|uniref:ISH3 family transposase n=1 Tax=Methanococcoides sp. TaxID=1966350 RepID=UPI00272E4582|nr:ISH3 family transposase [Methanococcoides sp.]
MFSRLQLTPYECTKNALQPLLDNIHIPINGSLTCKDLFHTVLGMAVDKKSAHSINKQYLETPCETSIRYHLKKMSMDQLIESNAKILMQTALGTLNQNQKYDFAIDYTNDPYYGKRDKENKKYLIRGQAKKSTNTFYSYVSLYIINKNKRFTISVLPVENGKLKTDYINCFIKRIDELNFKVNVLCLDREFYSSKVFAFLQEKEIPHIIPVVKRGRKIKTVLMGRKKRYDTYVMKGAEGNVKLDVVIDVKYKKGNRGETGCENFGFVVYGTDWDPRKVSTTYRKRFAIEASYRMRNIVKPKTSSKNPMFRYFYTLVSFLLKNTWVTLQRRHFTRVKRGPQVIEYDMFRFDMFIHFVMEWVRKKLRVRLTIECCS